ncbi:MAG: alpha-L-fucosidase [Bacteroidales bacterium]|jgi:hypothetical protein|nr:alpha-L-fucosidase [Bacteroidales bacterium]
MSRFQNRETVFLLVLISLSSCRFDAREEPISTIVDNSEKMEWFADAKLGIFIHWGMGWQLRCRMEHGAWKRVFGNQ